jgi:hypothetical protein
MRMHISKGMLHDSKHSTLWFAYRAVRLSEAEPTFYELERASTHIKETADTYRKSCQLSRQPVHCVIQTMMSNFDYCTHKCVFLEEIKALSKISISKMQSNCFVRRKVGEIMLTCLME